MDLKVNSTHVSAGLAAIGVLALAATGYVNIITPEAQQCMVDLADAKARLELHGEAMTACKKALQTCTGDTP